MIIDKMHPQAASVVVRRLSDGAMIPFVVRIDTDAGWIERYKVDNKLRVAAEDKTPPVIREKIEGNYEVILGVPPYIKVKGKDNKTRYFRRADVIPAEPCCGEAKPKAKKKTDAKHPPYIKVKGQVYTREDLVK